MKIAVIPARSGSRRIPQKNIKNFCGKPMVAWSIIAAKTSGLFEHIIVSTDDAEIAEIAIQWGAEAPFIRPAELSNDHTGTTEVIAHAIQWAMEQDWPVATACCIYATAPFVQVNDLKQGLKTLESGDWEYTFAATDFTAPVYRSFKRHNDGGVEMLFPEHFSTRSQDLPSVLHDAGQFYWGLSSAWLEGNPIFSPHSAPIIIPNWRVQDIDNPNDWIRAELIYKQLEAIKK